MAFDPAYPLDGADLTGNGFRTQFNGLHDEIPDSAEIENVTTLNPGESATAVLVLDGTTLKLSLGLPRGADGTSLTAVIVDSVTTLDPGESAFMTATLIGTELHLALGIPRGADGADGAPFASVVVDGVTTLAPGENATVEANLIGSIVHLTFGIPRGADGNDGAPGAQGIQGLQGEPGEVTLAQLNSTIATAIAGTSSNTNAIVTLDTAFTNDPLSLADGELLRAKLNELILNGRR